MSSKGHLIKEVMEAVTFLRENNTIPSETIEFMKQVSLKAVEDLRVLTTNKRLQIDLHKKFGGEHLGTRYIKYPIAGVGVAARDKSSEFNNVIEDVAKSHGISAEAVNFVARVVD